MTVSKKSIAHVTSKKSQSAAVVEPEANVAAVSAPATSATPATSPVPTLPPALLALVTSALQTCDTVEDSLDLNIVVPPNDKAQMLAMNRVSNTALALASDIITADPARFPDLVGLPAAAAYVATMTPLATRLRAFANHLDNSILNQQSPAAQQTLVLYSMVKGLGRMAINQAMREKIAELKAELVPKRKSAAPKQTKAQKAVVQAQRRLNTRLDAAKQLLAANEPTALAPVASPAAAAASPVVTPAPKAAVATSTATPTTSAPAPVTQAAN